MADPIKADDIITNIMILVGTKDTYKIIEGDSKEVIDAKGQGLKRAQYTHELLSHPEKLGPAEMSAIQGFVLNGIDYQADFSREILDKAEKAKTTEDKNKILQPLFDKIPSDLTDAYTNLGGSKEALHQAFIHAADKTFWGNTPAEEMARINTAMTPIKDSLVKLADTKTLEKIPETAKDIMTLVSKDDAGKAADDLRVMFKGGKAAEAAGIELKALIGKGLDGSIKYTGGTKPFTDESDKSIAAAKDLAAKAGLSADFDVDLKKGYQGKEDKAIALEDVMEGVRKSIEDAKHSAPTTAPAAPTTRASSISK